MSRPDANDDSRRARDNRATYELHEPGRRRPLAAAVNMDHWDQPPAALLADITSREARRL
jgi:hypothetical protein